MTAVMNTMSQTGSSSRYTVGIDLGTTNSAVAYFDAAKPQQPVQQFYIHQQGKHGHDEALPLLPSFLYLEGEGIPVVGTWAKIQGAELPTRLIQSAKSWLSNPAADRKEKILPFESSDNQRRLSALEASTFFLEHIKHMWNRHMAKSDPSLELEEQTVVLTVPASFDEVARALTFEAAQLAGLKQVTLLEEPQAAFYSWLMEHDISLFKLGQSILVCDVGGGTTDFSWIDVLERGELRRMAVGKHLLLGGDNMDAALCHLLEKRSGLELDITQHLSLLHQVRSGKEILLGPQPPQTYSIFIPGKGSQVVGGGISLPLEREELKHTLLEGFFGLQPYLEAIQLQKGSGIRQMGLPYESDPSITKHLAHFLYKSGCGRKPDYVLFNGGAFKPELFQDRIIDALNLWFGTEKKVFILESSSLDLAVARGAAYFAHGKTRITGGSPRSYYLEIETQGELRALTLLPRGTPEGTRLISEHLFSLIPNQAVAFRLYHSHTRLHDQPGDLVPIELEEMSPLPPIHTLCKFGKKEQTDPIPVRLEIYLTAIGTLELWLQAQNTSHRWKLEFQLRAEKRLADETSDVAELESAQEELVSAFAVGLQKKLDTLMPKLEKLLEKERKTWPPSLLRGLFDVLMEQADKRLLAAQYESKFWNLAGFFLRPGFGYPLDDHRVKQLWRFILADLKRQPPEEVQIQQWICYRRIAAGLSKGQQIQLFNELLPQKIKQGSYPYAEHLRALASFELVDISAKTKLGNHLLKRILAGEGAPCDYWALGRLGARQLFHGTAANVIPVSTCAQWVHALLESPAAQNTHLPFTLAILARKTNLRQLDLPQSLIDSLAPLLQSQHLDELLQHERALTLAENERFFGDSLPSGLLLQKT